MTTRSRSEPALPTERADALQEYLDSTQVPPTVRELVEAEIRRLRATVASEEGANGSDG